MSLHPPELVFHRALSKQVDMWNLGSTVNHDARGFALSLSSVKLTVIPQTYELVTGRPPFEADFDDQDLVSQFQVVLGGVPEQWISDAINTGVFKGKPDGSLLATHLSRIESLTDRSEESSAEDFLPLEQEIRRSYRDDYDSETLQLTEKGLELLEHYLRKLLVVDPSARGTPRELLDEPWVSYVDS